MRHARVAERVTNGATEVIVIENGDRLLFNRRGAEIGERVPTGRVFIDGSRTGEIADEVIRDRKHLAADGLVVPVVAINRRPAASKACPTSSRAASSRDEALMREAPDHVVEIIASASVEERTDVGPHPREAAQRPAARVPPRDRAAGP